MTKTALVTGSSKGIGKTIAIRLGKEGYITYVTYKSDGKGGEDTDGTIIISAILEDENYHFFRFPFK